MRHGETGYLAAAGVDVALAEGIAPVVAGVAVGSASLREPSMPPDESPLCEVQIARVILSGVCR